MSRLPETASICIQEGCDWDFCATSYAPEFERGDLTLTQKLLRQQILNQFEEVVTITCCEAGCGWLTCRTGEPEAASVVLERSNLRLANLGLAATKLLQ